MQSVSSTAPLTRAVLTTQRKLLEDLLKRKFYFTPAFSIYGGVAGLYDYGPPGCAIKNNVEKLWRDHFVLEEDMLEINGTSLTPYAVLKASGHVDRFEDLLVRDVKSQAPYRADKLVEEHLEKLWAKTPAAKTAASEILYNSLGGMKAAEMKKTIQELGVKSPDTGNDLTDPEPFNLMFGTPIGPTGYMQGFLRPETAQSIFVNFKKLLDYNNGRIPFASAQIGLGFRNEIAPRAGLLRVREFTMGEIEHFVDPKDKSHPKFKSVAHLKLPLFSQECQEKNLAPLANVTLGEAVSTGIINNETLGYFMGRVYLFLESIGIETRLVRFRQHMKDEMAHYAADCWDAEIEMSYGWIECVGIADRSCYDLTQHSKAAKTEMVAARKLDHVITVEVIEIKPNKAWMGKNCRDKLQVISGYLEGLTEEEKQVFKTDIESHGEHKATIDGQPVIIVKDMVASIQTKKVQTQEEKFLPSVIEPSFGFGRIIYGLYEHRFRVRDARRTYLDIPVRVAPIKCAIQSVVNKEEFNDVIRKIETMAKTKAIPTKVDFSNTSIGTFDSILPKTRSLG